MAHDRNSKQKLREECHLCGRQMECENFRWEGVDLIEKYRCAHCDSTKEFATKRPGTRSPFKTYE